MTGSETAGAIQDATGVISDRLEELTMAQNRTAKALEDLNGTLFEVAKSNSSILAANERLVELQERFLQFEEWRWNEQHR